MHTSAATNKETSSPQKTALIIGATGITGAPLTQALCDSPHYQQVITFSRRAIEFSHPKHSNHIVDFANLAQWQQYLTGNDLFSAFGTTRKAAGGKQQQYLIEHDYHIAVLRAAAQQGVERLFLVSAPGADSQSRVFYSRMKGDIEKAAKQMPFTSSVFFQPSIILGNRQENRPGEKLSAHAADSLIKLSKALPFKKLRNQAQHIRPITGETLARSMVAVAEKQLPSGLTTYSLGQIQNLLNKNNT